MKYLFMLLMMFLILISFFVGKQSSRCPQQIEATVEPGKNMIVSFELEEGQKPIGEYYNGTEWFSIVKNDIIDRHAGEIKVMNESCTISGTFTSCTSSAEWISKEYFIFYDEIDPMKKAIEEKKTEIELMQQEAL